MKRICLVVSDRNKNIFTQTAFVQLLSLKSASESKKYVEQKTNGTRIGCNGGNPPNRATATSFEPGAMVVQTNASRRGLRHGLATCAESAIRTSPHDTDAALVKNWSADSLFRASFPGTQMRGHGCPRSRFSALGQKLRCVPRSAESEFGLCISAVVS